MKRCKITVLKRSLNRDLVEAYLDAGEDFGVCPWFSDGQEVVAEPGGPKPDDFGCTWAWADIRNDMVAIASGSNFTWIKQPGTAIVSCTDCFRPVIFKIERLED